MARDAKPSRQFASATLPWLVAAGALAVYSLTLNHWISFNAYQQEPFASNSLLQVARVSGWTWQPDLFHPLLWLVTLPFRWLPAASIPLALNLFSVACAALTLALLARSVALLPRDRTEEQRMREHSDGSVLTIPGAWAPPLLAVLVCGLQLTFWENATVASGEMFNLLLFAYVVRCLLEFRLDGRDSWLFKGALVYGAAMTNDWAMVGFFPAFALALAWIKGISFFNLRFLTRIALCGVAGLLLYLLLPLTSSAQGDASFSFWEALKHNLWTQKTLLLRLPYNKWTVLHGDRPLWILTLPSLLPVFVIGFRWPSYFGDPSRLGVAIATLVFHFFHAVLLLVCLWIAFDPLVSPRHWAPQLPFLPFYYLGALSVGYYLGYFLLVFGAKPLGRPRPILPWIALLNRIVTGVVWLVVFAVPALLVNRNFPQVRTTNGPFPRQYADLLAHELPPRGVVLSDDQQRLFLVQAWATQNRRAGDYLFVDTPALLWPTYHHWLHKARPTQWNGTLPVKRQVALESPAVLEVLDQVARSNTVCYLHPSFGYFFELFYPEPHGLISLLKSYRPRELLPPPLAPATLARNEAFWTNTALAALDKVATLLRPEAREQQRRFLARVRQSVHLVDEPNREVSFLGQCYSRSLDFWGVELQKQGRLQAAAAAFQRALDLNPDNLVAQINLEANQGLQQGKKLTVEGTGAIEDRFGKFRNWDQIMTYNGPFDDPTFCMYEAFIFLRNTNYRLAAQQFARVQALAPDFLPARIFLAQLYVATRLPDEALKVTDAIHQEAALLQLSRTNAPDLLSVEAGAHLSKGDVHGAEQVVRRSLDQYPGDEALLGAAAQLYIKYELFTNALEVADQRLRLTPDNPNLYIDKAFLFIQLEQYLQAIPLLSRALSLETNVTTPTYCFALLDRAVAYLKSNQLDDAQRDYETLQKSLPNAYQVFYGLHEIAFRKNDTNAAILNGQLYLTHAPTNSLERSNIVERLAVLKRTAR